MLYSLSVEEEGTYIHIYKSALYALERNRNID